MNPAVVPSQMVIGSSTLRILFADDNEVLCKAVEGLFRLLGHSVDIVTNGRDAVEAAAREAYGVVFLDIQMPEMDGLEAARSIRVDCLGGDRTRIVGISADAPDRSIYEEAGMDGYLTKPIRLADLVGILSQLSPD